MNFPQWLTASVVILAMIVLYRRFIHQDVKENFFWDFTQNAFPSGQWRWPWQGHFSVPWFSGQSAFWQQPFMPWRPPNLPITSQLPATGGVSYPGPGVCEDHCPANVCREYRDRQSRLNECLRNGEKDCYDRYGCRDVDFERKNFGLIDPKFTRCQLCPN